MATRPFGDTLAARVAERESQLVLGLDPDPNALWPGAAGASRADALAAALAPEDAAAAEDAPATSAAPPAASAVSPEGAAASPATRAAAAVVAHCAALIDAAGPACVAVKPQLACFERLGVPGRRALDAVLAHARAAGLLVIADGKRGDIDVTARAYAQALFGGLSTPFGELAGLGADLATVNPLMGRDTLEPFVASARATGAGVLLLVRTSNPGAVDVQELALADDGAVWERLARIVDDLGRAGLGREGVADVGAVLGATAPERLARARELMPHAVFLLPGVGAQGGRVQDLAPAFAPGPAGGLVSASRSIADAHTRVGGDPAAAARAEAERLRAAAWSVALG